MAIPISLFTILKKMSQITNVVAGSRAALNCPTGMTYHGVKFDLNGIDPALLKNVEVVINGKTIQKYASMAEIDELNRFHGRGGFSASVLTLFFSRPEMQTFEDKFLTVIGTKNVDTFTIEFDIDDSVVDPLIYCTSILGAPQELSAIMKIKRFPTSFAVSGQVEIADLPRNGARIMALHLRKADISKVEVEVNGRIATEGRKAVLHDDIKMRSFPTKVPMLNCTSVDFCVSGYLMSSLETAGVQDLRIRPTLDTPGAVTTIVEYVDSYGGM